VIKSFERTTGEKLKYSFCKRRKGDVPKLYGDSTKANNVLNWKANFNLDDMTLSSWKWEQKNNLI